MREGWEIKTLGDIGKVSMCKRILKNQTLPNGDIPFYKIGTFGKIPNAFISKVVHEEYLSKYSFPKKGDILLSASGTIGRRVVYDGEPAYFQDSNIVWIANNEEKVLNEFLYLFYDFCDWNPSRGATISRLYNDDLRRIKIPIPPLQEQRQIVAILDQTFEAIDQAKANIEKNIVNAKELFQSKLNAIFSQKGDGWEEKSLGEIYDVRDGTHDSPKYRDEGYPLITSKNLKDNLINYDKVKFISNEDFININKRSKVDIGDVLFAMIGTIGNPVVITKQPDFAIKNVALFKVPTHQNSMFLRYFLNSVIIKMISEAKGTTQPFVGLGYLRNFLINIPSFNEQNKIVEMLNDFETNSNNIQNIYKQKLTNLEDLKKSILQKAFSGALTKEVVLQQVAEPKARYSKK
jgi:restriction endonuclease S subunit